MNSNPQNVEEIFQNLRDTDDDKHETRLGHMLEAFGHRSYGPALLIPAIIELSPIGGIPGVPTVLATIIVLFSIQILMGQDHLWLPGFIENRSISNKKLNAALDKMTPLARWMDRHFHDRIKALVGRRGARIAAICSILLALTVPPLELIPFASSAPMSAIAMFGLSLLMRDGWLMIAAIVLTGGAFGLGAWLLFSA